MRPVRAVEMAVDDVVDVIAVRHRFVPATLPMLMIIRVASARMALRTPRRIRVRHPELVLVDVITVHVVHVPIMQVIRVTLVVDLRVPASRAVRVRVAAVRRACTHASIGSIRVFPIKHARRSRRRQMCA
jgi:hypothetical protein